MSELCLRDNTNSIGIVVEIVIEIADCFGNVVIVLALIDEIADLQFLKLFLGWTVLSTE